jgi:hypothetical protein
MACCRVDSIRRLEYIFFALPPSSLQEMFAIKEIPLDNPILMEQHERDPTRAQQILENEVGFALPYPPVSAPSPPCPARAHSLSLIHSPLLTRCMSTFPL